MPVPQSNRGHKVARILPLRWCALVALLIAFGLPSSSVAQDDMLAVFGTVKHEESNKKLSDIYLNAIQNSNLQRILWISKEEPRNNILEIDNLTYIKHSGENDFFDTVLNLEEVEEVNEKFIDLK